MTKLLSGNYELWWNQSANLLDHLSGDTHQKATINAKSLEKGWNHEIKVVRNRLHTVRCALDSLDL